jgi:hypothetical protein
MYVGFPKYLYHHKHAPDGRVFNTPEETQALGPGWVDSPTKFPGPSRFAEALRNLRPWWVEWEWAVKAAAVLIGLVAAIVAAVVTLLKLA